MAIAIYMALFFLGQTLLAWFLGDAVLWLFYPVAILFFIPPLGLFVLFFATVGTALTRPRRRHVGLVVACSAIGLACTLMWTDVYDAGSRLYFAMHKHEFRAAAELARAGGVPVGNWLRTEVDQDYVAFDMGGFFDNRLGVVHVTGETPPLMSEFGLGKLIRLDPLGDGWYLYGTT